METATTEPAGLLLVDKPGGLTSHDVVAIIRRAAGTQRVGHTGTLDPFATGLLVVLIGRGTRLIPYVDGEPKVYDATVRFGAETDTDDATGVTTRTAGPPSDAAVNEAILRLTGPIDQTPPAYSAKQVAGTRAYAAARRGKPLVLATSRVTVHEWTRVARFGETLVARISCSRGTYIRALARDLGQLSGSAAHLAGLRRIYAGPFSVSDAVSVDDIRAGAFALRPLGSAIPSLPVQRLDSAELRRVVHGNPVLSRIDACRVALVDDEENLIAVAEASGAELRPTLVLRDA